MSMAALRARRAAGDASTTASISRDADVIAAHLEDAAHFPGGFASGIAAPASEAEVAALLRASPAVLPIGAQSSLTGGATPRGELLLSTARLNRIVAIGDDWIRAEAGVTLVALDAALAHSGRHYPPVPTFTGAFVGGIVSTNAAGAATFKYGATRDWVRAITVVLANGDILDIERGRTRARSGRFELTLSDGVVSVSVPTYRLPQVAKVSAGYFAAPEMDLIDLFIGSEGTLGVITAVTLRVLPVRPAICLAFVPFVERDAALSLVSTLRRAAQATWRGLDAHGLDISAIEHMDARSLEILRDDGVDRACGVTIPASAAIALLIALDLAPQTTAAQAFDEIGRARDRDAPDTPLVRLCRSLDAAGVLDRVEIAVPGDTARQHQLRALREAVPAGVNARIGRATQIDSRIAKTAADMIVPFERVGELMRVYDEEFRRRGLDAAVWGHISDGNLHPNVIPRTFADVEAGRDAILEFGRSVRALGGSPLAEHGVGRNPTKQRLLRDMYGDEGIEQMRAVKRALDPEWKLAPGVLVPR
ncbi:MAG TPA: FAD-binding oxidoreductase [Vicinamibacterales bacterium]|nr:FAD-binding oxidoreductase [Vicinamibacterales bacterium]